LDEVDCFYRRKMMKTLVVYDSVYGNTEKIAKAIAGAVTPADEVQSLPVSQVDPATVDAFDRLIVGSPTQAGRPTPAIQTFLRQIPADALDQVDVTAFDTRFSAADKGWGLRILMNLLGYAAGRIAGGLQAKGGQLAAPPQGFIVEDKEGPLAAGEVERAAEWAKGVYRSKH
jgi:flavodoxin I